MLKFKCELIVREEIELEAEDKAEAFNESMNRFSEMDWNDFKGTEINVHEIDEMEEKMERMTKEKIEKELSEKRDTGLDLSKRTEDKR